MNIKPIHSEADYRASLREIETLMTATVDSPEGDRLDVLVTLVEVYERALITWRQENYQDLLLTAQRTGP